MDQNPDPVTAPINEDAEVIVRVPVQPMLRTLPYYAAQQRWTFHHSTCPQCSGESCFPCEAGGNLAISLDDDIIAMRDAARWN